MRASAINGPAGSCGALAVMLLLMPPADAGGSVASALLREGDVLIAGETISALNNTAVNHAGGYACSANTSGTGAISHIWGNASGGAGALLRSEGTFGDLVQTSFESFYGMGDAGELAYGATADDTGSGDTGLDGVWLDDVPVLNELDPVASLPGQFSTFNSRPSASGSGVPVWVGGISATQGGATQNRCLFSGLGADVLIMGGDSLSGVSDPVSTGSSGIDFDFRVSRLATNWINAIGVTSSAATDIVMVINGTPVSAGGGLMREGSPVPAALGGLPGELWSSFDNLGINEAGDFFVTGDTGADVALDEFVSLNGQIVLREGDMVDLDGTPVPISGAIEGGYMNEQTDWAVEWDVNAPAGNIEVLIVNGQIALAEGDDVDWDGDGVIGAGDNHGRLADFTGISALTLGARSGGSVDVYFTADIDFAGTPSTTDDLEGFLRLTVAVASSCPWDCGTVDLVVSVADFLALLTQWGQVGTSCDIDGGGVSTSDFLDLLSHWGPC